MLALCQHNTLAYYAFYYAGIFDAGLKESSMEHEVFKVQEKKGFVLFGGLGALSPGKF